MSFLNNNTTNTNSSATLIPEDVIRYIILPYKNHIDQIYNIEKKLKQEIKYVQDNDSFYMHFKNEIIYHCLLDVIEQGLISAVAYILHKFDCDPTSNDNEAIRDAARHGHIEVVKYLCELKDKDENTVCDPTAANNGAIISAAENGHFKVVKYLHELKDRDGNSVCDPTTEDNAAIRLAAREGHLEVVRYLHELKDSDGNSICDPTAHDNYAIRWAVRNRHIEVVKYLRGFIQYENNARYDYYDDYYEIDIMDRWRDAY